MSHISYQLLGPFISLEPTRQGYYMVEFQYNESYENYTYQVYHAKTKDDDYELLQPTPTELICADTISFFKLELKEDILLKTFLQRKGNDLLPLKFEPRYEFDRSKKEFKFEMNAQSTIYYNTLRDMNFGNIFEELPEEMIYNFILNRTILDDNLFKKYQNHFDRKLIYNFWKELFLNHTHESYPSLLEASWLELKASQNHHFVIEFLIKIYEFFAKLMGKEVCNISTLQDDLRQSEDVIHNEFKKINFR